MVYLVWETELGVQSRKCNRHISVILQYVTEYNELNPNHNMRIEFRPKNADWG